jgi:hypothetical protein
VQWLWKVRVLKIAQPSNLGGRNLKTECFWFLCRSLLGGSLSAYVICGNFISRFLQQSRDTDSSYDVRMASHKPFQFIHCDLTQILLSHQNEHMYTPPAFCTLVLCAKSCWGFYLLASISSDILDFHPWLVLSPESTPLRWTSKESLQVYVILSSMKMLLISWIQPPYKMPFRSHASDMTSGKQVVSMSGIIPVAWTAIRRPFRTRCKGAATSTKWKLERRTSPQNTDHDGLSKVSQDFKISGMGYLSKALSHGELFAPLYDLTVHVCETIFNDVWWLFIIDHFASSLCYDASCMEDIMVWQPSALAFQSWNRATHHEKLWS